MVRWLRLTLTQIRPIPFCPGRVIYGEPVHGPPYRNATAPAGYAAALH
jgi:hypothetical protein